MNNAIFCALTVITLSSAFQSCKQEPNKFKVGYLPIAECLPLYVAKEKGYFEKFGLEVELVSESGGPAVFKGLENDAIDIGFSNVVTLVKQNNLGKDYKSIYGATYETETNHNHAIFGRKDTTSEINGDSKFGVNAWNNIEQLMLLNFLKQNGVALTKDLLTHIVEIPFPQMLSNLKDKNIDFACMVEPSITIAKRDTGELKYFGNHYQPSKANKILVATYVAKQSTIKEKREDVNSFIAAMALATKYINENNTESRDFIKKYSRIDEKLLSKISLPEFSNQIDESELSKIIQLMYNEDLNFDRSFISKPENIISASNLIFKNE